MVNSETSGIQRGAIRKARIELGGTCRPLARRRATVYIWRARRKNLWTIWQWVRVKEGLDSRYCHSARVSKHCTGTITRNRCECSLWQSKPKALIREEEEGSVLQNWTAERPSAISLP